MYKFIKLHREEYSMKKYKEVTYYAVVRDWWVRPFFKHDFKDEEERNSYIFSVLCNVFVAVGILSLLVVLVVLIKEYC